MSQIDLNATVARSQLLQLPSQYHFGRRAMYDRLARLACTICERSWCKFILTMTKEQVVLGAWGPFDDEPFHLELPVEFGASDFVDVADYKILLNAVKTRCATNNSVRALTVCALVVNDQRIGFLVVGDAVQTEPLDPDQVRKVQKLATLASDLLGFRLELRAITADSLSMLACESSI